MKVTCTGRRVTLKPSFIENAEKRLAKLDKFFPDEAQAQVTVTVEKSGQTVEIMLRSKDLAMRAEKTDERMEDALAADPPCGKVPQAPWHQADRRSSGNTRY